MKYFTAFAVGAALLGATSAQADTVDFDEFPSPPVTCCFGTTGVTGPLIYPHVIVQDANNSGFVMNGDGWNDLQTSGDNLFGTLSGAIFLDFFPGVSNVTFDLINGLDAADFVVTAFGMNGPLEVKVVSLTEFTANSGNVANVSFSLSGIYSVEILGNEDFAIDTISFDVPGGAVPEPASWALMIGGFAIAGGAMRRRTARVAYA